MGKKELSCDVLLYSFTFSIKIITQYSRSRKSGVKMGTTFERNANSNINGRGMYNTT